MTVAPASSGESPLPWRCNGARPPPGRGCELGVRAPRPAAPAPHVRPQRPRRSPTRRRRPHGLHASVPRHQHGLGDRQGTNIRCAPAGSIAGRRPPLHLFEPQRLTDVRAITASHPRPDLIARRLDVAAVASTTIPSGRVAPDCPVILCVAVPAHGAGSAGHLTAQGRPRCRCAPFAGNGMAEVSMNALGRGKTALTLWRRPVVGRGGARRCKYSARGRRSRRRCPAGGVGRPVWRRDDHAGSLRHGREHTEPRGARASVRASDRHQVPAASVRATARTDGPP